METDRFQRLSEIFERAVALPVGQRAALLDEQCNGDAGLRAEVEDLLKHSEGPDDPVVTAAGLDALFEEAGLRPRSDHVSIPDVIGGNSHHTPSGSAGSVGASGTGAAMPLLTGAYRILRVVGEGGMGIVYEAEQAFPKRKVALKSIRPGLFSRRMLRRFQNEAHILGRLQHPGIAQIYEAGASDPQRPDDAFFVMEFVDGPPLTTYAESRKLGTRQRVELMIKVCEAVQHAHLRGVIHRDLKPANILVTDAGGTAEPKILDFGVARVTDDLPRADSMHTGVGQLVGTLAYMSPEQISGGAQRGGGGGGVGGGGGEADTRADVYALGVTLYQLLSGRLPHDLADKSIPDAAQIVRDSEPSRLGTIDRTYRGDLETIVAKAMDKDRARRYQSAAELGEDLQRYLGGEAIAAKRDSAVYVLRKQIRRHKGAVAAGVVIFVGLVAFGVVAAMQAKHNRMLAEELADQLTIANCERGRLQTLSGSPLLGERVLWSEFLQRPEMIEPYWALWEYYARQPIVKSSGGLGIQPGRLLLTPDGTTLFRTGRHGEMQAWSTDLERCLWKGTSPAGQINEAAMMPDGKSVVCSGTKGKMFRLSVGTGEVLVLADIPTGRANCIVVTPDGEHLIVGDSSGSLVVRKSSDLSVERTIVRSADSIFWLALSPDGKTLVVSSRRGQYTVWDLEYDQIVGNLPIKSETGLPTRFSADGATLYALTTEGSIHAFATNGWTALWKIATGDAKAHGLYVLDNGTLLTSGPLGVRVWDAATQALRATLPGDENTVDTIVPGHRAGTFYTSSVGTALKLWETTPFDCFAALPITGKEWILSLEPDASGKLLGAIDTSGMARVFDVATRKLVGECKGPTTSGRSVSWRPGHGQFAAGFSGGYVGVFEASSGGLTLGASWVSHETACAATAYSADGKLLATGAMEGEIRLWNPDTHELVRKIPTEQTKVYGLCFSPDGKTLAAAGIAPGIALYDVGDGHLIASIPDRYQNWRARFSPDGKTIAAARSRTEIEILDAKTLALRQTMRGHITSVGTLGFDPSGELLVSGSADRTIRLWNVRTGRSLLSIDTKSAVSYVGFIPGTRTLAASGQFGWAAIVDLARYEQAIAGNLSYFYQKLGASLPHTARKEELIGWGRRITGNNGFAFTDPIEQAPWAPGSTPTEGRNTPDSSE